MILIYVNKINKIIILIKISNYQFIYWYGNC